MFYFTCDRSFSTHFAVDYVNSSWLAVFSSPFWWWWRRRTIPGGPKNEATLHFAKYLENYQRYLHFLHTSRPSLQFPVLTTDKWRNNLSLPPWLSPLISFPLTAVLPFPIPSFPRPYPFPPLFSPSRPSPSPFSFPPLPFPSRLGKMSEKNAGGGFFWFTLYNVESNKILAQVFSHFPKWLRIFSPNFTRLLRVPIYARLQILFNYLQLWQVMPY